MRIRKDKGLRIVFLTALGLTISFSSYDTSISAESSARSLFMSTAGSTIQIQEPKATKDQISRPSQESSSKKRAQVAKKSAMKWTLGLQTQVLKVSPSGNLEPINPNKYIFREGDKFKVRVTVNSPGIIMFYNIDPKGESTYLGAWPIDKAFTSVELPYDGYFEFYGAKGVDKLYIFFKPCQVQPTLKDQFIEKTTYSRSIRLVQTELTEKIHIKDEVRDSLPICSNDLDEYSQTAIQSKISNRNFISYSRSIRTVYDNADNSVYAFHTSQSQKNKMIEGNWIIQILNLQFK